MKNFIRIILCSSLLVWATSAKAEWQYGVSLMGGQLSSSGTESEGTAADTSTRSKSFDEIFFGGDIYLDYTAANGITYGVSYVPVDIELGSGKRTDTSTGADQASEADTGTRSASADVSDLITLYTNIPVGGGDMYALLGVHMATISTSETLPNSSYGNEDIFGAQIGFGAKSGNIKYELFYSEFEEISISSTGGDNSNSVTADADALTFRIAYGF